MCRIIGYNFVPPADSIFLTIADYRDLDKSSKKSFIS